MTVTKNDTMVQALVAGSGVRAIAAVTTQLTGEACRRHGTSRTATAALGRALTGALLLGRTFKDLERVTLQFQGRGPAGTIFAEASSRGTVRGYITNPAAEVPLNKHGKLDVGGLLGPGLLHVIREAAWEMGFSREPYYGSVPLVSGEIAEDLANYLLVSEQISSAVSLGVFTSLDEAGGAQVTAAGGYLIQLMPGADEETIATLETAISLAPHTTEMIRQGADASDILRIALNEMPLEILEEIPVALRCSCSPERAFNLVAALGNAEITDMLEQDHGAKLTCHFCNEVYWLDEAALRQMLEPPMVM
ncbi:MAG: Hsp33 family molecular chaperone HslO [Blastocatellia bacterium]